MTLAEVRWLDASTKQWRRVGFPDVVPPVTSPVAGSGTGWSAASPPWQLQAGESVNDNLPAGVTVVDYDAHSSGGALSVGATLQAIRKTATGPYYVRMSAGTFHLTDFNVAAGSGTGKGYQDINSAKYFGGLIGAGADKTFIVVDPSVMTSAQLSGVSSATNPVQMYAIYAGSPALTVPTFFSGITFRGNFQQVIPLASLAGSAPAPYVGLSLSSVKTGSRVQFCRFQGFGFDAKASPPYELGSIQSGRSDWTLYRTEIDGRLAPEVNSAQPVSAGGLMWNYENSARAIDSWMHHTRRSGFATHDPAPSEGGNANAVGVYYVKNFQVENVANTADGYAGTVLGFAPSNVEEVRQSFTYVAPRFDAPSQNGPQHLNIATSHGNALAGGGITISDPIIANTAYNGCLYVHFVKTPNSAGVSPYWTAYQSGGFAALPLTVTVAGVVLTPILAADFNSALHGPSTNFIVAFS